MSWIVLAIEIAAAVLIAVATHDEEDD